MSKRFTFLRHVERKCLYNNRLFIFSHEDASSYVRTYTPVKSTLNYLFNFNDEIYADTGFAVHEKKRMESCTCRNSILGILE